MTSNKTNLAIVFNCYFNGLSIIQELGKNNIQCIAMDCVRDIGTFSKYAKYQKCPDPLENEYDFIHFLYNFCKELDSKPVLFPTNDHWAVAISKNKKMLSEVSIPVVADWETVKILINKDLFYKIGAENNYLTPRSWSFNELNNLNEDNFPIVAKPTFRRISSNEDLKYITENMDRLRFNVLKNKDELNAFIKKEEKFIDKLIFQEYINGMSDSMYTVGIYANDCFEILGLFTGHKVRGYPADSGDCVIGECMKVPDYIIENTKKIVKDLKFSGIAEFEYKKDSISGEFKLIEINPRSWSWIGITPACGVSLPLIAYKDSCGQKVECTESNLKDGSVKYVKIIPDFFNCNFNYKKNYPQWSMSFFEWIRDINTKKTVFAEFNAGDWNISIKVLYSTLVEILGYLNNLIFKHNNKG